MEGVQSLRPVLRRAAEFDDAVQLPLEKAPLQIEGVIIQTTTPQSRLDHRGAPVAVTPSPRSRWAELVADVSLYLNAYGGHAQVLRYARTASTSILLQNGGRTLSQVRFVQDDAPVAVGFGMSVDGVRFKPCSHTTGRVCSTLPGL